MSKSYRPYDPDQLLLPAAEWLPEVWPTSSPTSSSEISRYERERRGGPPYHPRDDGQGVAVRLLRRCGVLPTNRPVWRT